MCKNNIRLIIIFSVITFLILNIPLAYADQHIENLKYDMALQKYKERELETVIKILHKIIKINDSNASYYALIGNAYFQLHKKNDAIKYYDRAIELEVNDPLVYYNRAIIEESFEYRQYLLHKSLELDPLNILTNTVLVTTLQAMAIDEYHQGNYKEAIQLIHEAKNVINRYLNHNTTLHNDSNKKNQEINLLFSIRLKQLEEMEASCKRVRF